MHSAELRLGIRKKIPTQSIASMFFFISLTSLALEMMKHRPPFKFIRHALRCKRGKGPISLAKALYFTGVLLLRTNKKLKAILLESSAGTYSMRLMKAFAIIRVETEVPQWDCLAFFLSGSRQAKRNADSSARRKG